MARPKWPGSARPWKHMKICGKKKTKHKICAQKISKLPSSCSTNLRTCTTFCSKPFIRCSAFRRRCTRWGHGRCLGCPAAKHCRKIKVSMARTWYHSSMACRVSPAPRWPFFPKSISGTGVQLVKGPNLSSKSRVKLRTFTRPMELSGSSLQTSKGSPSSTNTSEPRWQCAWMVSWKR